MRHERNVEAGDRTLVTRKYRRRQVFDAIGQAAGRLLMARLEEPDRPVERVVLPPQLVIRESCGAPPSLAKPRKRA